MKKIIFTILTLLSCLSIWSCFDDIDDVINPATDTEINTFIWNAMNNFYLYQANIPDLSDDRFSSQIEFNEYSNTFDSPESFFENLIYNRNTIDKYSWIVDDYEALEASFTGQKQTNGMAFGFFTIANENNNRAYGYIRYITPNSEAEEKGLERGMIFDSLNNLPITYHTQGNNTIIDNSIATILSSNSYTIGLATFNGNTVNSNNQNIVLNKRTQAINPVHITKISENGAHKIGYLLYNSFTANYDDELNQSFSTFKNQGITDLVLDLRYNSGGSVLSAITLSSLITGQFNDQIFSTEEWNSKLQPIFSQDQLTNRFVNQTRNGNSLHSLNLSRVYIITTGKSASASELVIAGLRPYIDVIQIGTTTEGKFQASITLYDSPTYSKTNVNPVHKYALQPLVLKSINSVGFTDYSEGISPEPQLELAEDYSYLSYLGNEEEPLFNLAIAQITGNDRNNTITSPQVFVPMHFQEHPLENDMHKEFLK